MSELKAFEVTGKALFGRVFTKKVYDKDEADKVIAEKDAVIADLEQKLAAAQLVLRLNKPEALYSDLEIMSRLRHEIYVVERRECHQKYKRCLAMAEVCCEKKENCYNRALRKYNKAEADYLVSKSDFWEDWEFLWLKIAERFKEAK